MKACYRIGIVLVWTCYFLLSGVTASSSYAMELIDRAHPSDTNVVYYNLTPPGDKGNYIKQFSAFGPEYGTDVEMLSKSSLDSYETQLTEINQWTGKDGVKVYVLLINGLSTSHYNTVPEEANDVSKVLEWSKNKKTIQSNFNVELEKEGKKIIEQIAAQQASIVNGPSVFCSLIAFEVKYGEDSPGKYLSKKVILYHSTAYGFSDKDNYLKVLDASIASSAAAKGSIEVGKNMDLLIESIRFSVQADLKVKVDGNSLRTLSEKLYATHSKGDISRCIDTLSKSMVHTFDNPLREHVIRVLLGSDEASGSATGNITVYSKVPNAGKNAITVLDNIDDVNIDSWYTYINNPQRGDQTTIQFITQAVPRGVFGESDYDAFTKMINRQILHYKRFDTEKTELLTREDKTDHLIAWDNSYVMKFFTTAPINTNNYVIKLESTGKLKLTKSRVTRWDYYPNYVSHSGGISSQVGERSEAHWEEETPLLLDPFELVAFINRSDLSLLANKEATTGSLNVLPAIHLLYAQEKKIVNIIGDGVSIASNVASIFPPIAEITYGPVWVRRFIYGVELSDKISSYVSLSATLGVGGNDFKDIADAYGAIQDYMSHGVLVYGIANTKVVRDMANYVFKVSQREKELTTLAGQSEEIRYALEIKNNIDREAKALKGEDWVEKALGKATSSSLEGFQKYPKITTAFERVVNNFRDKGVDHSQFESVLRKSDNLDYLEENTDVLTDIADHLTKQTRTDAELLNIFNHAVNVDFVKDLLPSEFTSSLKVFGKSEDEIFDYFKNYHNIHTKADFFNEMERIMANPSSTLTLDETLALWAYTTNFFYLDLNKWLRDGLNVSKTTPIANLLKDAIRKVPNYEGQAYRALEIHGEDLEKFMAQHKKGERVTYSDFTSCGSNEASAFLDKPKKNVKILMDLHRAPDISDFSDGIKYRDYAPKELLLRRGSYFEVIDSYEEEGVFHVYLKQLN